MKLQLGFSPCPNDTFIFDALVHGKVDTRGLQFDYVLEDVETLNQWALEGRLDITKLSYGVLLGVSARYALLHSGSALGNGVGPLLIAASPLDIQNINNWKIAIPGRHTTANMLLSLAFPQATNKTEVLFSEIEPRVKDGEFDAGLVIHESRFTYADRGLHKLMDMGDWWEGTTGAAIPLGGIVARRSLDKDVIATLDAVLKDSVAYAWKNYPHLSPFVTDNAQEMSEDVMRKHIELYVNDYTTDLGTQGGKAIQELTDRAKAAGLMQDAGALSLFY
jgi:1,4-dihydroxy-6-naphthoate synthase